MQINPTVSIIVPVYNGAEVIRGCIDSLLIQDCPNSTIEILVIDNASTDNTLSVLSSYDGNIRILHEAKRGAAAARNRGLECARGSMVAFIDADCVARTQWLHNLIEPLADPEIGLSGGRILSCPRGNGIERYGERIHDHQSAIEGTHPAYAISMNWASPISVLRQLEGFDETLLRGQDVDLAYRICKAGYLLKYRHNAIIHHLNETSIGGLFNEGRVHGECAIRIARKHREYLNYVPFVSGLSSLKRIFRPAVGLLGGTQEDRFQSLCAVIFNAGKFVGQVVAWRGQLAQKLISRTHFRKYNT